MATWLYPISKEGYFDVRDERLEGGYDNFRKMVFDGRLNDDPCWTISTNYRQVNVGDDVFLYTGDGDRGIIGYAVVENINAHKPSLELRFDEQRCKQLVDHPVPAKEVRKWIFPRRPVVSLTPYLEHLNKFLPWQNTESATREYDAYRAEDNMSQAGAGFGDPVLNRKVETAAVRFVEQYYADKGWTVESMERKRPSCSYDLYCSKDGEVKKVEVKGIRGNEVSFILTRGEKKAARDKDFVLHAVCNALSQNRKMHIWTGEDLENKFSFTEISYRALLKKEV